MLFLFIGFFLKPDLYPGTIEDVILNFSGFYTKWNPECWFLFPYSILSLFSVYIFRLADKFRIRYVLLVAFIIYCASGFFISRLHVQYMNSSPLLYYSLYIPNMLLCFLMGSMACRCDFFNKFKKLDKKAVLLLLVLASLLKMYIHSEVLSPFYAFLIAMGLVVILGMKDSKFLSLLGKHSMNIWLMHTWLLSYLFGKYFYSLEHPILIVTALLFTCILLSNVVDYIYDRLILVIQHYFSKN